MAAGTWLLCATLAAEGFSGGGGLATKGLAGRGGLSGGVVLATKGLAGCGELPGGV